MIQLTEVIATQKSLSMGHRDRFKPSLLPSAATTKALAVALALCASTAKPAGAEPPASTFHHVELGLWGGWHVFDPDVELGVVDLLGSVAPRDSAIFGVRGAFFFVPAFGLEVEAGMLPTSDDQAGDSVLITTVRAQAVVTAPPLAERLRLFLVAGGGWMTSWTAPKSRANVGEDTDFSLHWGAGFKVDLFERLLLRVDFRHVFVPDTRDYGIGHDFEVSLGLGVPLGAVRADASPRPVPVGVVGDRDGDGIADDLDRCPDEAENRNGFEDADGCPDRVPHLEVVDVCAPGDDCNVRFDGCAISILERVEFRYDRSELDPRSFPLLDSVARVILGHPWIQQVEIQGHTDGDGSPDYNLKLSQGRALAVTNYLVSKGIDATRLIARGYGMSAPLAPNTTAHGKAQNRRVEFVIVEPSQERCAGSKRGER